MSQANKFRSLLPHEPFPSGEELGYLHVQGAFEPRRRQSTNETFERSTDLQAQQVGDVGHFWTPESLENALLECIPRFLETLDNMPRLQSMCVLDRDSPLTKVQLIFTSLKEACTIASTWRRLKVSPMVLFQHSKFPNLTRDEEASSEYHFSTRALQVTPLTTAPMPSISIAWPRSNPPKFRRLLARPGEDMAALEAERDQTRFVFVSGLLDKTLPVPDWWNDDLSAVIEAIRCVVNSFDTSNMEAEVFISNKKVTHSCHIGMRAPHDARRLIETLQGKRVEWMVPQDKNLTAMSDKLFLDYADVTQRSYSKIYAPGGSDCRGEPSRSECTSLTQSVKVPGLVLIPDFVSAEEEEVLLAALTGPHAPWAPSQRTPSMHAMVKRRVQHYGYVFDYETANVLRDRSVEGANCPPMPALAQDALENLEDYVATSTREGRGWEVLAGLIERTRRHDFSMETAPTDSKVTSSSRTFPNLNQMTVNEYKEGSGIGSHVDTPSAFGEGLVSISLGSGIVMEFRHIAGAEQEDNTSAPLKRKLVYLSARSLLLMSGAARYEWEHMIVTRKTDTHNGQVLQRGTRVSLTLRTALDAVGNPMPLVESPNLPPKWPCINDDSHSKSRQALTTPATERDHVHAVYNAIATQWHHTRGRRGVLWPGATQFLKQLPPGSIVADVGCGDGKYFPAIWEAGSYVIGTDISEPLLRTTVGASATDQGPESRKVSHERIHLRDRPAVAVADCMNVPLRSKSCDAAVCIAVMHHLSTEERRLRCIEELERIVRVGGTINIQAWAMEQQEDSRRKFAAADVFVPFNAQPKHLEKIHGSNGREKAGSKSVAEMLSEAYNGSEFDERKGLVVFKRYCHLYRRGELEELVARVPGLCVVESGYESGNYFVILRVISS